MSVTRREWIAAVAAATVATNVQGESAAPPNAEAEARIASIFGRYGNRFSAEQKDEIARNVRGAQSGLEAMRAYPLDNAIEPATIFRVYKRDARRRTRTS